MVELLNCLLLIVYCLLSIAYYLLLIIYCLLLIVYCLLPIAYCLLLIVYCLLSIAYCLLLIAYCLLSIAYYIYYTFLTPKSRQSSGTFTNNKLHGKSANANSMSFGNTLSIKFSFLSGEFNTNKSAFISRAYLVIT